MPPAKDIFAGMSDSGKKKKLTLILVSTILVVGAIIGIVIKVSSHKTSDNSPPNTIIKSTCSSTRYPDLCLSQLQTVSGLKHKIKTKMDVINLSLNLTLTAVQHNYFQIQKIIQTHKGISTREKTALHDCLQVLDETLDELHETKDELQEYPNKKKKQQLKYTEDLKTLLSGAMTNQDTCIDGFSHDGTDQKIRKMLLAGQVHAYHMVSNALAMICNMTGTDMMTQSSIDGEGFPKWMSVGDRRLLQAPVVEPDVVVAADGSGNYTTVAAAVEGAPKGRDSSSRYVIRIKAGTYRENVEIPKKKTYLMFIGDGRKNTIITGSRNVVDGSTTFHSATVAVVGAGFLARDMTFENTAGPSKHQAVALRVGSDLSAFYQCDMLGYQDTLYVHKLRQFYVKCLVAGTVDFIFGNAAAILQDCDIHARRPNSGQKNMMTAQGRDDPNQNTGIVIQNCKLGATEDLLPVIGNFSTYLGRPWKEFSRTVIMQSSISNVINPVGWHEWNGDFALDTLYYAEYQNTGAGAGLANRVNWTGYRVFTSASEVEPFTVGMFLEGDSWLGSTGFPFSLGL